MRAAIHGEVEVQQSYEFESMNLQVGSKLQLTRKINGKDVQHFTALVGYVVDDFLLVKTPVEDGFPVTLREGEVVVVRVFTGVNVCSFVATVDRVFLNQFSYVHLSFPTSIKGRGLRKNPRVKVSIPAGIAAPGFTDGAAASGTVVNLSVDGALVESAHELKDHAEAIRLSFQFVTQPGDYRVKIETEALIRNMSRKDSPLEDQVEVFQYGLQFKNLDQTQQMMLQNLTYEAMIADRQRFA